MSSSDMSERRRKKPKQQTEQKSRWKVRPAAGREVLHPRVQGAGEKDFDDPGDPEANQNPPNSGLRRPKGQYTHSVVTGKGGMPRPGDSPRMGGAPIVSSAGEELPSGKKRIKHAGYRIYPDRYPIRAWWEEILDQEGEYPLYAFLLAREDDTDVQECVQKYLKAIDEITGETCLLVIAHIDKGGRAEADALDELPGLYSRALEQGVPATLANVFVRKPDEFPCLLIFQSLDSWEAVAVPLKDLKPNQILDRISSVISRAIEADDPYAAVKNMIWREEIARKASQAAAGAAQAVVIIGGVAGLIKAIFGQKD